MIAPWTETTLPTILSCYPAESIFHADEFGLFYQCLPNKILHFKEEKCSGGVIAKFASPAEKARSFKGVKDLPCRYRAERKSWMSAELSEDWLRELDQKFGSSKRKIALITVQPICTWKILSGLN